MKTCVYKRGSAECHDAHKAHRQTLQVQRERERERTGGDLKLEKETSGASWQQQVTYRRSHFVLVRIENPAGTAGDRCTFTNRPACFQCGRRRVERAKLNVKTNENTMWGRSLCHPHTALSAKVLSPFKRSYLFHILTADGKVSI